MEGKSNKSYIDEVKRVKKKIRPDWKTTDWKRINCASRFNKFLQDYLLVPEKERKVLYDNTPRIDGEHLSADDFSLLYDKPNIPCVITGLQKDWDASDKWNWDRLSKKLGMNKFRVGDDIHGKSVKISLNNYVRYALSNEDDSPLYVFDSDYGESEEDLNEGGDVNYRQKRTYILFINVPKHRSNLKKKSKKITKRDKRACLMNHYKVPSIFNEDLFSYSSRSKRPPYKWFVMGPPRSGTGIHIDPLGTSAWNALVKGRKWWVLFPNDYPTQHINHNVVYDQYFRLRQGIKSTPPPKYDTLSSSQSSESSIDSDNAHSLAEEKEPFFFYSISTSSSSSYLSLSETDSYLDTKQWEGIREEGIHWFERVYAFIFDAYKRENLMSKPKLLADDKKIIYNPPKIVNRMREITSGKNKPMVILQKPGETIFVPAGWWHVVLNIDYTICVTQNFVSLANLPAAWKMTTSQRPKLAESWFEGLVKHRPEIAAVIKIIDPFVELQLFKSHSYGGEVGNSDISSEASEDEANDIKDINKETDGVTSYTLYQNIIDKLKYTDSRSENSLKNDPTDEKLEKMVIEALNGLGAQFSPELRLSSTLYKKYCKI
ncbi:unnamed protein product [Gordionus sp. m RMFG-2023]